MKLTHPGPRVLVLLLVALAGGTAAADFQEAMGLFTGGKYLEAAQQFQAMVDEHPNYAYGHFMLGACFQKTGKPKDAEKSFLKAIELEGDRFEYHFNLANVYKVQGNYPKVVTTLNNAEDLAPDNQKFMVHKLRGFALAAQKKWGDAAVDLERAAAVKAEAPTLTQLGKAYFALGQEEKAVTTLRRSIKLKPDLENRKLLAETLLNLAARATSESTKQQRYGEALTEAEAVLQGKPSSSTARYLVGRAALGAKQYDKAIDALRKVLESRPDHCNAMTNLAMALIATKNWASALVSADNATVCEPGLGIAWENKGFVLQKMGSEVEKSPDDKIRRYEEAIRAYERANKIRASSSIQDKIAACRGNIDTWKHNINVVQKEAEQDRLEAEEKRRLAEEERKRKEWEEKRDD